MGVDDVDEAQDKEDEVIEDDSEVLPEGKEINFLQFLKYVLQTRPQNPASVLDISQLRRYFCRSMEKTFKFIDLKCVDATTRKMMVRKKIKKLQKERQTIEDAMVKREEGIIEYQMELQGLKNELQAQKRDSHADK